MNLLDVNVLRAVMCFFYRTMVASVPLLMFAIQRCDGPLREYYLQHAAEELGHDEMLKADLAALGVTDIPLSHQAAQIAGSQYHLIAHEHPALLLGYMLALERDSLTPEQVDALGKHHGVTLTALRHHSEHDPIHRDDLLRVIAGLPESLQELVRWNERSVYHYLPLALNEHISGYGRPGYAEGASAGGGSIRGELRIRNRHGDDAALGIDNIVSLGAADLAGFFHAMPEVAGRTWATNVVAESSIGEMDFSGSGGASSQEQKHDQVSHKPSLRAEYVTTEARS